MRAVLIGLAVAIVVFVATGGHVIFLPLLFVLDGEGVIRWSYVSPVGVNPGADGILTALESMGQQAAAA